ncbi:hypothetical protein [Kitasatospora sp. NPDC005856]|uniref:hypothetical protein n=1 Tax=Kitasatospora sp. NPDC005856 TaxID=3154566 RepID=UPI0033C98017
MPSAPPALPAAAPSVPQPEHAPQPGSVPQSGPGPQPGYVPQPEYGPTAVAPPALGSWGAGQTYDRQPALRRLLTAADWRPAVKVAVAPTLVLMAVALIAAIPSGYQYQYRFEAPGFGERFGAMLSMAVSALGAPFRLAYQSSVSRGQAGWSESVRMLPMTVTVLWCLALWLGLRAGLRRRKAVEGQLTRGQAAAEAMRTAAVLAAVSLVLGLVGGTEWNPDGRGVKSDYFDSGAKSELLITADSGWLEAVAWTVVPAALLTFLVYGTDALRWAAWRSRSVRGWAVAALTAGQALAVAVGLSSVVAFLLVALNSDDGTLTGVSLAFLPNLGLGLLGFGSGAGFRAHSGLSGEGGSSWRDRTTDTEFSFFDLRDLSADWRWAGLIALVAAGVLGWWAYRRRLDTADRLRLAALYAGALTLLMAVAGARLVETTSMTGWSEAGRMEFSQESSVGLVFLGTLVANAVWALVGALLVPPLLVAVRDRGAGAPSGAVPYAESPFAHAQGAAPHPGTVPPEVPYATPAHGVPVRQGGPVPGYGVPAQAAAPQDAPFAPGDGVSEVLASHEESPAPAGGAPVPGAVSPRPVEEPVDPSVWREHP